MELQEILDQLKAIAWLDEEHGLIHIDDSFMDAIGDEYDYDFLEAYIADHPMEYAYHILEYLEDTHPDLPMLKAALDAL